MLTTQQAAAALNITPALLRQWVSRGKIPKPQKFGRDWMFSESEIERIKQQPRRTAGRPTGENKMKMQLTATLTGRNSQPVTVEINADTFDAKTAKRAAMVAFGHTDGVTVSDGATAYEIGKRTRRIEIESYE